MLRFIYIIVKANDELLRGRGEQYKRVCARLELNPVMPLVTVYGIFRPRDLPRFIETLWLRRKWANNAVLLELPDELKLADPNSYEWGKPVRIQSPPGSDSQYCEDAAVLLRKLTDIHDQNDVGIMVDELLQLSV